MSLLSAELRKVWGNRVFPMLLAVLVAANLLLLWMGTRPTANQPPAAAYRAVGADLATLGSDMDAKGNFLHGKLNETESLLRLENYFRESAYGNSIVLQNYREENADLFDQYEEIYRDKSYTLYTDSLTMEYRLLSQLVNEYDTVAGYSEFLDGVQTKATQLAGLSIFQNDESGYDLKNIEVTAAVYAGLGETAIDYFPQKGLYTAISYAFTDLILLASMLVLALMLVRQERDSGLLSLVRSLPGGRLQTAVAKLGAFALSLLVVLALLYGVNLAYCGANFGLGPLTRTIQSVPALMRCTMQITVGKYLLRFLLNQNINYYLKEHPDAWLVYESGYRKLFGFTDEVDVQDTLLAGLACALCFSGLFAMERRGGMETILCVTPLGRKRTVRAKLLMSGVAAFVIAVGSCLPHLIQVLRDYGLPALFAPAMSISEFESLPAFVTLSDVLLFWFLCRVVACLCMATITLTLGHLFGNLLPALFVSAVGYCLPALLSLSGMDGGIEWLGFWPLFHAANFLTTQGYAGEEGLPYNNAWMILLIVAAALLVVIALAGYLEDTYEMKGVGLNA